MPPIKEVDLSNGIRIEGSGVPSIWIRQADFPKIPPGEAEREREMEGIVGRELQANYEDKILLSEIPGITPDDPLMQDPPVLLVNERIEKIKGKDTLITTTMWVSVHVYSTRPLRYTVKCRNPKAGPITGEWW